MSSITPSALTTNRSSRRLDIALAVLLLLTLTTWLIVDGSLTASDLTIAVFVVTSAKAVVVMAVFMELWHGPRWASMGLATFFAAVACGLAILLS